MRIFKKQVKLRHIFLVLVGIIGAYVFGSVISVIFFNGDYNIRTFRTQGEGEVRTVKIDTKGLNIVFKSRDYDEGIFLLSGYGAKEFLDINQTGNCLYIKNKDENYTGENKEFEFTLPEYYKNKVSFIINSSEGNIDFQGSVNVENISCHVLGGNITGPYLAAEKAELKVDDNHGVFLENIEANEKITGNI